MNTQVKAKMSLTHRHHHPRGNVNDSRCLSSRAAVLAIGFVTVFLCGTLNTAANDKPNVILVITDDQGYGDIGAHGNKLIQTPNMDQLHAESVRFTNFHVDPTCAPTRGALMSGKYSHRAKVWHTIAGGNHLRASEKIMADVFSASGYRTGMFGKWLTSLQRLNVSTRTSGGCERHWKRKAWPRTRSSFS